MPDEVQAAIAHMWQVLPIGAGKDFNTIVKHIEHLTAMLYPNE